MKLFLKYFIKYLEKHQNSEHFYDFSWVYTWHIFMKNHEILPKYAQNHPKIDDFGPKIHEIR